MRLFNVKIYSKKVTNAHFSPFGYIEYVETSASILEDGHFLKSDVEDNIKLNGFDSIAYDIGKSTSYIIDINHKNGSDFFKRLRDICISNNREKLINEII